MFLLLPTLNPNTNTNTNSSTPYAESEFQNVESRAVGNKRLITYSSPYSAKPYSSLTQSLVPAKSLRCEFFYRMYVRVRVYVCMRLYVCTRVG